MLEYDNSAFYYFSITLLVIYLIPSTWYVVAEFVRAFLGSGELGAQARTSEEEQKAKKLKSKSTGWGRLKKPAYIINLVLTIFCWAIFLYLISLVKNDGEVSTFDPFTILGIEQGATPSDIKKAYRSLSLKFHPDKNPGNKKAEEIFMKVAKAYEALTDETAKENYEKYGNPDGKQALEVSIGLPRLLLDNPKVVLILYLIAMVIVIPVAVGLWYANSKQYGENNVKNRTYQIIYSLLQEGNRVKHMPEILAASDECQSINSKPDPANKTAIAQLYGKLKNDKLMVKPRCEAEVVLHGNLLLHAHMLKLRSMLNEVSNLPSIVAVAVDRLCSILSRHSHSARTWTRC
jgi:translocation protein SEC63